MWEGYCPRGEVTLLGAHGGTGKSTIGEMLAVAVVTGRPLFGVPTERAAVVFASLEDGAHVVRHRLVGKIVEAYELFEAGREAGAHEGSARAKAGKEGRHVRAHQ